MRHGNAGRKFNRTQSHRKAMLANLASSLVEHEQISLLVFPQLLFTFRERSDDLFDSLRQRLLHGRGRIRAQDADYLAYVVMDTVVDRYFTLADALEEVIEAVEERLLGRPRAQTFTTIQRLRRELVYIRKAIAPLREVLTALLRSDTELIGERTEPYFRDVADHIVFMDGGVIVEEGPAEQLINNPQHQRTQAFLAKFEGE